MRNSAPKISAIFFTLSVFAMGCNDARHSEATTPSGYIEITPDECEKTGINGNWKLVNIRTEGKNNTPTGREELHVSNCSKAVYVSDNEITHTESFKMLRVIQYCADYQLVYNHDSISCINFRKDTLIIGACNDYETTRYYYKRM